MRRMLVAIACLGLAGPAVAQDEEAGEFGPDEDIATDTPESSETYEPGRDIVTDEDLKPDVSLGEKKLDSPLNTEYGSEDVTATNGEADLEHDRGLAQAKAGDLEGRTVVTLTGEEVGEIGKVGASPEHDERIATIDVGGFLGVGEKTIAVPLSNLHRTPSDGEEVRISLMKTSMESAPAFDESTLTPAPDPAPEKTSAAPRETSPEAVTSGQQQSSDQVQGQQSEGQ